MFFFGIIKKLKALFTFAPEDEFPNVPFTDAEKKKYLMVKKELETKTSEFFTNLDIHGTENEFVNDHAKKMAELGKLRNLFEGLKVSLKKKNENNA